MQADIRAAEAALERVFGFTSFRPGQRDILEAVLAGENVLAVMPTGAGKSLCYQLPALVRRGLTIVVSPLIALMRDQVQQLRRVGIAAAALNSSNSGEDNALVERGLRDGRYRLVYVAPERLVRPDAVALLRDSGANVLAIDEAHCVSQWGHDFRPEYLGLAQAARAIGDLQFVAVTATADAPTRADIVRRLFSAEPRIFVSSFDRPNLHLAMRRKSDAARQIEAVVKSHKGQSGIVYAASRNGVEKLARSLSASGVPALAYHAGLEAEIRSANQDEFLRNDGVVIVATVAFGMGVDKPNVRFVCHADLPQSVEAYYQEIGRAGRDGLPADTLTLFSDADILLRERQIAQGDAPEERKRLERRKLQALIALCETPRCRRQTLLAAFGEASQPCGNCDICEGRWPFFNGAVAAQKVMSAIHRTSGRFFSGHLANLLVGRATEAIKRHGHDLLPTFGVGKELKPSEWRSIFHQLHAENLIAQDQDDRDRWVFTEAGRAVLKGDAPLTLRGEITLPSGRKADRRDSLRHIESVQAGDPTLEGSAFEPRAAGPALTAAEHSRLAALKGKRLELARAQKIAPYMIFHDSVLIAMAQRRPQTGEAMRSIPGVGPGKLERYGSVFLAVLAAHDKER
ncbi:DNA helicase RecQ [Methylocapsa acidiphila]|uniref:DNA helicase RecQ n=1 Tax=Methylocapsa acidiphila TaxID=133552 RepID=Q2VNI1_METAI|nr:DNA helicase RecQ [Methylocapsa acidiphila]CAJ01651.1 putative dna helicase recQ [Methylocapsa acidiphila]